MYIIYESKMNDDTITLRKYGKVTYHKAANRLRLIDTNEWLSNARELIKKYSLV